MMILGVIIEREMVDVSECRSWQKVAGVGRRLQELAGGCSTGEGKCRGPNKEELCGIS